MQGPGLSLDGNGENSRSQETPESTSTQDPGVSDLGVKHHVTMAHFNPFRAGRGIQAGRLLPRCGFPQPYLLPQKGLWNLQASPGGMQFQPLKPPKALASMTKGSLTVSRCLSSWKGFWRNRAAFTGPGVCDWGTLHTPETRPLGVTLHSARPPHNRGGSSAAAGMKQKAPHAPGPGPTRLGDPGPPGTANQAISEQFFVLLTPVQCSLPKSSYSACKMDPA